MVIIPHHQQNLYQHISTVKPAGHASTERPVFIGKRTRIKCFIVWLRILRLCLVNSGPSICSYQLAVSSPSTCQGPPAAAAASANLPNPRNLFRLGWALLATFQKCRHEFEATAKSSLEWPTWLTMTLYTSTVFSFSHAAELLQYAN